MNCTLTLRLLVLPALFSIVLSGCSSAGTGTISAVTPLPTGPTAAPDTTIATPEPASARPTVVMASTTATATPTPLSRQLSAGSALAIAQATDAAIQFPPRQQLTFDESPVPLTFDEFYDGYNMRSGLILSDKLLSLDGQEVVIEGYMAPPLKAELDWFVLTRVRLAYCPFCSTAADWPNDIALIYLNDETIRPTEKPMRLQGRLEVGPAVDPETGMVSVVRIYAGSLETL